MRNLEERVLLDLVDWFEEFNDDPDAPFGELPRVTVTNPGSGQLIVRHQHGDEGVVITVREIG